MRFQSRTPAPGIDGDQVRVDGCEKQRVAENRQAARDASAAEPRIARWGIGKDPEYLPGRRIQREHVVALRRVHDSIDHEWRGLVIIEPTRLKDPFQFEVLRICGRDLRQGAVALTQVRSRIREPVLRFLLRVQNAICETCASSRWPARQHRGRNDQRPSVHCATTPLSEARYATRSVSSCPDNVDRYDGIGEAATKPCSRSSDFVKLRSCAF